MNHREGFNNMPNLQEIDNSHLLNVQDDPDDYFPIDFSSKSTPAPRPQTGVTFEGPSLTQTFRQELLSLFEPVIKVLEVFDMKVDSAESFARRILSRFI